MRPDLTPLTRGQRIALAAATFLLVVAATTALGPLIAGSGWWWLCAFMAAGVLGAGAGMRAVRTPASLVPVLELVVVVLLLTLVFGGSTSFALVIPTADTFDLFASLLHGAERTIQQQSVPAIAVPALLYALALGIGVLSVVADFLVQTVRMPAFAAAPALVPILIPGFIIEQGADLPALVVSAGAFLLLLRLDVRIRRRAQLENPDTGDDAATVTSPGRVPIASTLGVTVGLAAVGIVAASVLTAFTPSVSSSLLLGTSTGGSLFARGASPFIDLGRDLRRPDPVPAFSYSAEEGDRPYFTLLTLDRFEGEVWGVGDEPIDPENTVDAMPQPQGLGPRIAVAEHPIDVRIERLRTSWLPVPYPTESIDSLEGSWFWDRPSLTVRSVDADTEGQSYQVVRLAVQPTVDQLRNAGRSNPADFDQYLALPEDMPPIIADTAAAVTANAGTRYDAAVAIQEFLRGSDFHYSTRAPVEQGYDGGGFGVIASFLEQRSGYCVHFASTMAVLARATGIPARISVGYTSGTPTDDTMNGLTRVEVDSHDLHAWPELYFPGVGWIPFEPTPGRGSVPDYTRPGLAGPGIPSSESVTPAAPASGRPDLDSERGLLGANGAAQAAAAELGYRAGGAVLVVVALLLLPALLRTGQRIVRRRRIRRGPAPATAAWDEVRATARDVGAGGGEGETPRAFAARVAGRPAFAEDAGGSLAVLRNAVERERYGPPVEPDASSELRHDADELIAALDDVCSALVSDARPATRIRAVLVPASLTRNRRRVAERPAGAA